jgi:hypothetical protein
MAPPFFIVGNPRSGTTLLRFILCSHSEIYIPEETGFLVHLQKFDYPALTTGQITSLVRELGQMNYEWQGLVQDEQRFATHHEGKTLGQVISELYLLKGKLHHATRWGDKGPSYVSSMDTIAQTFPDSQFIHMIRDGRDCCVSSMAKWGHQHWYFDALYLMKNWKTNIERGQASGRKLGRNRYLEIRYEDLVSDQLSTVKTICSFLNAPFEEDLLNHQRTAKELADQSGHFETKGAVSSKSIGNWRTRMSRFDQLVAQKSAGDRLSQLGYASADIEFKLFDRIAYLALCLKFMASSTARKLLYRCGLLKMSSAKRTKRN